MSRKEILRNNIWNIVFFLLLFILTAVIFALILSAQSKEQEKPTIVGGVFIGSVSDNGWNQSHYEGLKQSCDELGHTLEIAENVSETEEECQKAVDALVQKGCQVIFLTSDGFGNNVREVIAAYPSIVFYTISPEAEEPNVTTYYGRMYQSRYLAGILAGSMTKTNVLGFVAAMRNAQVDRDVNAYLLGARSVNPKAKVVVRVTGSWADEPKEHREAEALIDQDGADVLTFHSSTPETLEVAEERGIYSVGYNCKAKPYSDNLLTCVMFHWNILYKAILRDFARGSVRGTGYYWWGIGEGAVGLDRISPLVKEDAQRKVLTVRNDFDAGRDVFMGQIKSNDGTVMCRKDERMSDEALLFDMKWFAEGVEIEAD